MKIFITLLMIITTTSIFAKNIENSIFEIKSGSDSDFHFRKTGSASLVSIKNKKYLLTNYHVCTNDAYNLNFIGENIPFGIKNHHSKASMSFFVKKTSIVFDESEDLCLIPVDSFIGVLKTESLKIATKENAKTLTLASPFDTNTIANIKVLSKDDPKEDFMPKENGYKINFPIIPGMSGSPILNERNEITMVVWGRYDLQSDGIQGLTIGLKSIRKLVNSIK